MKSIALMFVLLVASSQSFPLCSKIRCRPSFVSLQSTPSADDGDESLDDDFLRASFQKAKLEKLGATIIPDAETAARSEGEFLAALGNVTKEFGEIKEQLGSDGAVKVFLDLIDEEEKAAKLLYEDDEDVGVFE